MSLCDPGMGWPEAIAIAAMPLSMAAIIIAVILKR